MLADPHKVRGTNPSDLRMEVDDLWTNDPKKYLASTSHWQLVYHGIPSGVLTAGMIMNMLGKCSNKMDQNGGYSVAKFDYQRVHGILNPFGSNK